MNLDLMIHGGKELPEDLKADAIRVRENIKAIMEGAAKGEFLEPVYDLCVKVILTQRKSDETFLPK